jgi:carboxyl-terminal processing protease
LRTIHRILIGMLAGLFFASGYAARMKCGHHELRASKKASHCGNDSRMPSFGLGTPLATTDLESSGNIDFRPIETLYSVLKNIREHYVEQITAADEGRMTYEAMKSMLASLKDPDTRFVEPKQRKTIEDAMNCKFHGIGATLAIQQVKGKDGIVEHLVVVAPLPASPAEAAGLRPGDDILAVDGKSVLPFDPFIEMKKIARDSRTKKTPRSELEKALRGEESRIENGIGIMDAETLLTSTDDKEIELTVSRRGVAKPIKIKLQPRAFTLDPVTSAVVEDGKYGYVKINCLARNTPRLFDEALESLASKNVRGVVVDLRNGAGGEIETAMSIVDRFAPNKTVALLKRSRNRTTALKTSGKRGRSVWKLPVVVVVNHGTAQTFEMLAIALRDAAAAKLVGEPTYGDLTHSTMIDMPDGSAVVMTTGLILSAKGKNYNKTGVPVDVQVASASGRDAQLVEAVKLLASGKTRS